MFGVASEFFTLTFSRISQILAYGLCIASKKCLEHLVACKIPYFNGYNLGKKFCGRNSCLFVGFSVVKSTVRS